MRHYTSRSVFLGLCWILALFVSGPHLLAAQAPSLERARDLYQTGKYEACIEEVQLGFSSYRRNQDWYVLWVQALMALGRYPEALKATEAGMRQDPYSIRMRFVGWDVYRHNSRSKEAAEALQEINLLAASRLWAYRQPEDLVALGRAALVLGADPKQVLDQFYGRALEANPELRDVHLAKGNLALDKHDFGMAADFFRAGLKNAPDDADMLYGLAASFAPSDRKEMMGFIEKALKKNPAHAPSRLLLADYLIDGEEYADAREQIDKVLGVNPFSPAGWSYAAIVEHLNGSSEKELKARESALRHWTNNPAVDHLIGKKLSQKYRFAEGAEHQRQALAFDANYLPAKIQLAQDLLRLGKEEEGWRLAEEVHRRDSYDITAYNLATLHDTMGKFHTLTNESFVVRMSVEESRLYGDRVLELLDRAKTALSQKYQIELTEPVTIEIFPEQKDFGVRTFGMPDNPGFLGVCFGNVITANSPASQTAHPSNWEAVLWHEFCHVITLNLTRNKMPRWLSEGVSVYEEQRANPVWGQAMTPKYREMILGDELTPIADLSAAFLAPKDAFYLQFAYFESAMAVDFLVQRFGIESLRAILRDLGQGKHINAAIEDHTQPLEKTEDEFAEFAREQAKLLGPDLEWDKPSDVPLGDLLPSWLTQHPNNFHTLLQQAAEHMKKQEWEEAKAPLRKLIDLCPTYVEPGNPYQMLAAAHRALGETEDERRVLAQWTAKSADATDGYLRLMELAEQAKDWRMVRQNADRFLAVNPLLPQPYRFKARAAEELREVDLAIGAYEKLVLLNPPDPADLHYRLATLLHDQGRAEAKRHTLQALEEAPRFRDAHRLLLAIAEGEEKNEETEGR